MKRIYIFTGKGGVGKSSVAAAHAMKSAEEGLKTLLISTDMAHNLGDIFGKKLGKTEVQVLPNLDIYEIDPEYVMQNDFKEFMDYIGKMLSQAVEKRQKAGANRHKKKIQDQCSDDQTEQRGHYAVG